MIKMMIATRRRPGMTHAEFVAYNVDVHAVMVRNHPARIKRYLQNDIFDGAFGRTGDSAFDVLVGRDNVTELYFDDINALVANATDPSRDHHYKDGINYAEQRTAIVMIATEAELEVAHPGGGRLKVYHFLRRSDGVAESDFAGLWRSAFERAVSASGNATHLRRVVWSDPTPEGKPIIDARGYSQNYHGYSTFWYDREEMGAVKFRAYLDALEALADGAIDHSRTFFLLAREQVIFDRR